MTTAPARNRRIRGATLIDGLIAAALVVMGAVAYYSMVPLVQRSQLIAEQQTLAVQISNRMVEHILLLKPDNLNATALSQLNLIDSGQSTQPFKITNLPMDDGWSYSPAKALPSGSGTLTIADIGDRCKRVKIVITWKGPNGTQTYTTGTVLGGHR